MKIHSMQLVVVQLAPVIWALAVALAALVAALSQHKACGRNCRRLVAMVASVAPKLGWNACNTCHSVNAYAGVDGFREFVEFDAELYYNNKKQI